MSRESGWGRPANATKWHYFPQDQGMSLCHKWGFYFGTVEQGSDDHPDNCAECKRMLASIRTAQAARAEKAEGGQP